MKASTSNLFVLPATDGVIESYTAVEYPISLKSTLPADFEHTNYFTMHFSVQVATLTADYETEGATAFWVTHAKDAVKLTIPCHVRKKGAGDVLDSSVLTASASFGSFDGISDPIEENPRPTPTAVNPIAELKSRLNGSDYGLKATTPLSNSKLSRRRSMHDIPDGISFIDELTGWNGKLKHVHVKTEEERRKEREETFLNMTPRHFIDELKLLSFDLGKMEYNESNLLNADTAESMKQQHNLEMIEKEKQIEELNAEIFRLLDQHERDVVEIHEQKAARVDALEKQNETRIVSLSSQHAAQLKQIADENASRLSSLTEQYESRVSALNKQLEEKGGQEELLEQQRVMIEGIERAKEREMKDIFSYEELKLKTKIQELECRVSDLELENSALKKEKEIEIGNLSRTHSERVQSLNSQQASAISSMSSQFHTTISTYREQIAVLQRQYNDVQQLRKTDAMKQRDEYNSKLQEYTAFNASITTELQRELDETRKKLMIAEQKISDLEFTTTPQQAKTPPVEKGSSLQQPKLKRDFTKKILTPQTRPIKPARRANAADSIVVYTTSLRFKGIVVANVLLCI